VHLLCIYSVLLCDVQGTYRAKTENRVNSTTYTVTHWKSMSYT